MTPYYRRFIRDYAEVAKPMTYLTRGENTQVKVSQSKKVRIDLCNEELTTLQRLKTLLTIAEFLAFPDFDKPFNLTTDASSYANGAFLHQGEIGKDKPISYISGSLNKTVEGFTSYCVGPRKSKELSVWYKNLHSPSTYTHAMGNRNNNAKLKRWKARIEKYSHELIYKPGRSNYVAIALSRLKTSVNHVSEGSTITASKGDSQVTRTASEGRDDDISSTGSTIHSACKMPLTSFPI